MSIEPPAAPVDRDAPARLAHESFVQSTEGGLAGQGAFTRLVAENATAALFFMDAQGHPTYMNAAATAMTGWTLDEIRWMPLHYAVHHHRPDGSLYPMAECPIDRALPENFDVRAHADTFLRRDGSFFPVLCAASPILDDTGRPVGTVVEVRDVTEERRAAEALAEQNALLKAQAMELEQRARETELARRDIEFARARLAFLAEAGERLAASLDAETTIRELVAVAVPTVADWAAYNVDAGDGTVRTVAIHHPDPRMQAQAHAISVRYPMRIDDPVGVASVLRTGEPELIPDIPDAVLEMVAQDAEHLAMLRGIGFRSIMNVPLVARGRVLGALGFGTGESGRRFTADDLLFAQELARRAATALDHALLYAEAQAARLAAEEANRAKSQFLSTMSHELRTPLNAIGGYVDLLLLGVRGALGDEQRTDLERIGRANRHLMALVTDILNFARIDAGQVEFVLQDVALAAVFADLEPLVAPQLAARGLAFVQEHDAPGRACVVRADPEKLRQVLLNLLTNAIKFTPPGGRISIGCETDLAAGMARVRVRDTGRGIPASQLERIFEPFVQVDRERSHESQQGVGLGLAISRDLVRGMSGELTVESAPGAGSTFTVGLPLA